jgi:hypothetical protein
MAEGHGWVVCPERVPTTPRWLPPALSLLIQGGERLLLRMSTCLMAARGQALTKILRLPYRTFMTSGVEASYDARRAGNDSLVSRGKNDAR